ncbi:MAG TPA: hypothetical protein VFE53_08930 [Mucilaginibacter sp.]|jgi:predicted transposase/invertase (TIGR01784 family)|nr:hypothetical protein [Mucilaginibacter sp.]
MYDSSMKYKWDNKNVVDYAVEEAKKEAKQEGELEAFRKVARKLKREGLSIEFIAETTSLSIEEIEKL